MPIHKNSNTNTAQHALQTPTAQNSQLKLSVTGLLLMFSWVLFICFVQCFFVLFCFNRCAHIFSPRWFYCLACEFHWLYGLHQTETFDCVLASGWGMCISIWIVTLLTFTTNLLLYCYFTNLDCYLTNLHANLS